MDVDASLAVLGGFGLVQTLNFLVYQLCAGSSSWHLTGVAFTIGEPDGHRCRLPPNGTSSADEGPYNAQECSLIYDDPVTGDNLTTSCLYGWDYNWTHGETSTVTDLDLVCDRAILAGTLTSIHFGGALAGSYILGQLSDIYGRRVVVLGSLAGIVATGAGLSFTWDYGLMAVLRFSNGFCIPGLLNVAYVRMIEMFTPNRRLRGQLAGELMWVAAISLLAPLAYLLPDWRHLQLTVSLLLIPLIPLVWLSFESVRWLVQKGRVEKAESLLQMIAKSKKISHSGYFLLPQQDPGIQNGSKPTKVDTIEMETKIPLEKDSAPETKPEELPLGESESAVERDSLQGSPSSKRKATILDLFKTRVLIFQTLIIWYCWFTSSVVYYGFYINSGNLVGNKYLNFFLISITEAPSYILNYFVMMRFGRRRPLLVYYIISGVACVVTGAIPVEAADGTDLTLVILVVAMLGKFFANAAFDTAYLVTAEVFPTVLRNAALGAAAVVGRAGAMVAPFIIYLNVIHNSIPLVAFGVISLVAGVLIIPLPETNNRSLPETLDDGTKLAMKEEAGDGASPTSA